MTGTAPPTLRHSVLHDIHLELGAKLVAFGGWEMPLSYPTGTLAEHLACRRSAALFDVSHLGTIRMVGPDVFDLLQRSLTNDLRAIGPGRAQYTHLLDDDGSVRDDMIVWWLGPERFEVMPNASNTLPVRAVLPGDDVTDERAVIALQGPAAREMLNRVLPAGAAVGHFCVAEVDWRSERVVVAGTGYTGEDGVECAVPASVATTLWRALLDQGAMPAGLGARDTLRLEAGLPLHGHELGPGITPLQARLSWVVGWDKETFIGRQALLEERAAGVTRTLRGVVAEGRQPPRAGAVVFDADDRRLGAVTSGNFSPMLERGIALALVDTKPPVALGGPVRVEMRGRALAAQLSAVPFWPPRGK
jgi:aminomethyltransferase